MFGLSKTWELDPRLDQDTFLINSSGSWQTFLMNDQRWPWIIVVPVKGDVQDIDDYHVGGQEPLIGHLADISRTLKAMKVADSTNVATLGNIVKQLHWHVVGRSEGDSNWPNPVWGFGEREPYTSQDADAFIDRFQSAYHENVSLLKRL